MTGRTTCRCTGDCNQGRDCPFRQTRALPAWLVRMIRRFSKDRDDD